MYNLRLLIKRKKKKRKERKEKEGKGKMTNSSESYKRDNVSLVLSTVPA